MSSSALMCGMKVCRLLLPAYQRIPTPCSTSGLKSIRNIFRGSVSCYQYTTPSHGGNTPDDTNKKVSDSRSSKNSGPKITLLGQDNNITITTLEDAQKISRRRDLKLVKMIDLDTKTHRAVYKLMTGAEFFEEDKKQRLLKAAKKEGSSKGEKMVTLSHRIDVHDLQSRLKNIIKWLGKNYEARIIINGDLANMATAENVCKLIEDAMKGHGRIVQKRQKGADIRFQIIQLKKDPSTKEAKENENAGCDPAPT